MGVASGCGEQETGVASADEPGYNGRARSHGRI